MDTDKALDWLESAATTDTGRACLQRDPEEIRKDLLSPDAQKRDSAIAECQRGAAAVPYKALAAAALRDWIAESGGIAPWHCAAVPEDARAQEAAAAVARLLDEAPDPVAEAVSWVSPGGHVRVPEDLIPAGWSRRDIVGLRAVERAVEAVTVPACWAASQAAQAGQSAAWAADEAAGREVAARRSAAVARLMDAARASGVRPYLGSYTQHDSFWDDGGTGVTIATGPTLGGPAAAVEIARVVLRATCPGGGTICSMEARDDASVEDLEAAAELLAGG